MLSQLLLNALIAGAVYALVGVGFALIFRVVRFFHFTHGLAYALGAYAAFALHEWLLVPTILAIAISIALGALFGLGLDLAVFGPLRARGAPALVSLLASLGLYIVGQNLLSMMFGDAGRSLRPPVVAAGMEVLGGRITHAQLTIVLVATGLVATLSMWLSRSRLGKLIRAVEDDGELAAIVGVPVRQVVRHVFMAGSALGAVAGVLSALDRDLVPTMGMNAVLMGVVAMIAGGWNSLLGVALGGLLLGAIQQLATLWLPSAWQGSVAFFVLIAFLLVRPQGLLGTHLGKAAT